MIPNIIAGETLMFISKETYKHDVTRAFLKGRNRGIIIGVTGTLVVQNVVRGTRKFNRIKRDIKSSLNDNK